MSSNRAFRALEFLSTRYLAPTVGLVILLVVGTYSAVLHYTHVDIDKLAKFTDAVFKTVALLIGTLWAMNRYFVQRVDAPQLRVDCDITKIGGESEGLSLLIYRLDLVNTGKTQLAESQEYVEIDAVKPSMGGVELTRLYRWPKSGWHPGGPIEPGSWSAINDSISCSDTVKVVRVFIEVQFRGGNHSTWHKTFDVRDKHDLQK